MKRELPQIIKDVGFDFNWDERKVWALDLPVEDVPITELTWHFAIPFWLKLNGYYDLTAQEVMDSPTDHPTEYEQITQADTSYPIDIMFWRGRWVILDGLHRLAKLSLQGAATVGVRKVPASAIPLIEKS